MKKILFFLVFIAVIFFLGHTLNPLDDRMFTFHDDTQTARVQQFTININNGIIPPRVAPEVSYRLGFPVFNFYSPFSYWIATAIHFVGFASPIAVKTAFLLAVLLSFIFMLSYLRLFFKLPASLLGAVAYSSSLWMAVEIFVRGNLAEVWFIALLPLAFYFLTLNSRNTTRLVFALTAIVLGAIFTVHNVFSLLVVMIFICYSLLFPHKKRNIIAIILGLGLGAYFLIPALLELRLTYAAQVATLTHFQDHFLCLNQLWSSSHWGYGGSAPGCVKDDMAFTLGKIHIVLGALGLGVYLFHFLTKRKEPRYLFIAVIGIGGAFLTLYASQSLWHLLAQVFSLFQFPWRFLVFPMFALAFFAAYGINQLPDFFKTVTSAILIFVLLFTSSKYFTKPWLYQTNEYMSMYGNANYIERKAGYNMAEYLPRTADYAYWRSLEGKKPNLQTDKPAISQDADLTVLTDGPFRKEISVKSAGTVILNMHYFPFWTIYINNSYYMPTQFDKLGRPIVRIAVPAVIHVFYEQTITEQLGNTVTILAFLIVIGILLYKPIWIRSLKKSHK